MISAGPNSSPTVTIPFDVTALPVLTDSTLPNVFRFANGSSGTYYWDFDPNAVNGGYSIFGPQIQNLSNSFRRYRIRSLFLDWIPAQGSGTSAIIGLGSSSDGAGFQSSDGTLSTMTTLNGSRVANASLGFSFKANFVRDWLYVSDSATSSAGTFRTQAAGVLYLGTTGASGIAVNSLVGMIRARGIIEFADLSNSPAISSLHDPETSPTDERKEGDACPDNVGEFHVFSPADMHGTCSTCVNHSTAAVRSVKQL